MKLGIMQPYFFPYLGYFSLIKHTDKFILFDTAQYIRHGWIARNRILKPENGWQYIIVPLNKHSYDTKIKDIKINNTNDWRKTIFSHLEHYKKKAPFYKDTIDILSYALDIDTDSIVRLNEHTLNVICSYIGIEFDADIFSNMDIKLDQAKAADEWGVNICKAIGNVQEYWNPEGGLTFYDRTKYEKADINIKFLKMNLQKYQQIGPEFEAGLSIIDVMMFNSVEDIKKLLDMYELL